jgi:hypothetical protein
LPGSTILSVWSPISPGIALSVLVALSCLAALIEALSRSHRRKCLRQLAAKWHMTYSARDRLRVLAKITRHFPVPGAADMFVRDVIYGGQGGQYRYVFTVEFTTGVIRGKRRQFRVATFSESRDRGSGNAPSPVTFATEHLSVPQQYESLGPLSTGPTPLSAESVSKPGSC